MQLNVIKVKPVTPEETTQPSTLPVGVSTYDSCSVGKGGTSWDVEVNYTKETSFLVHKVVDTIESSVEGRNLKSELGRRDGKQGKSEAKQSEKVAVGISALTIERL